MSLLRLKSYALRRYGIREQRLGEHNSGRSILEDTKSGRALAYLMQERNPATGELMEYCDIHCGAQMLDSLNLEDTPFLHPPYAKSACDWVGVSFDLSTDMSLVFKLFDSAADTQDAPYIIEINHAAEAEQIVRSKPAYKTEESPLSAGLEIPEKIKQMRSLYDYAQGSDKSRNFYAQGKFMEDYEDDLPLKGEVFVFASDYHALNLRQLRGYFSWRTQLRRGLLPHAPADFVSIYVNELLNDIGVSSPEEGLKKLTDFAKSYFELHHDASLEGKRKKLPQWLADYCIVHNLPLTPKLKAQLTAPYESAAEALISPESTDEEIVSAFRILAPQKLKSSVILDKLGAHGQELFARIWRTARQSFGSTLLNSIFGPPIIKIWVPYNGALYCPRSDSFKYQFSACRSYYCQNGAWSVSTLSNSNFNLEALISLLHESERMLREFFRLGRSLKKCADESWTDEVIAAVIEDEKRREQLEKQQHFALNLSSLSKIREEAGITRDSLLTDEERNDSEETEALKPDASEEGSDAGDAPKLEPVILKLITALLEDKDVSSFLKETRLMPSVAADKINEALFDCIGDNIAECSGAEIVLIEDYRAELKTLLKL